MQDTGHSNLDSHSNPAIIPHIRQIKSWFEKAVPDPETYNITTQIGVHLEEVAEMLEPFKVVGANQETIDQITFFEDVLKHASKRFKSQSQSFKMELQYMDRRALLDALCDQIVTAVGVAHMFGMDIEGGLLEVANSNDSKFDEAGRPIFNSVHKIMKGPNYTPPDLSRYI